MNKNNLRQHQENATRIIGSLNLTFEANLDSGSDIISPK